MCMFVCEYPYKGQVHLFLLNKDLSISRFRVNILLHWASSHNLQPTNLYNSSSTQIIEDKPHDGKSVTLVAEEFQVRKVKTHARLTANPTFISAKMNLLNGHHDVTSADRDNVPFCRAHPLNKRSMCACSFVFLTSASSSPTLLRERRSLFSSRGRRWMGRCWPPLAVRDTQHAGATRLTDGRKERKREHNSKALTAWKKTRLRDLSPCR